jgi:outer membrane protein assembly factor BamB
MQKPAPRDAGSGPHDIGYDVADYYSQTRASPLAFRGDVLVQAAGTELWTWDAPTMKRLDSRVLEPRHFCFMQDGTLAVFSLPHDSERCVLHRIDAKGSLDTFAGPIFRSDKTTAVLPARSPDEVYVSEVDEIVLFRIGSGGLEKTGALKHPDRNAFNRDQLVSLGDGRVVGLGDGAVHELTPGQPTNAYKTTGQSPVHLVAATGKRVWYSYGSTEQDWFVNVLVLARLASPMVADHRVDFAPWRIIHLGSGGRAVAVLVSMLVGINEYRAAVVVIDENGSERWRAEVPATFKPASSSLSHGFVAISDHRVVLARHDHALFAWDAATGKPII